MLLPDACFGIGGTGDFCGGGGDGEKWPRRAPFVAQNVYVASHHLAFRRRAARLFSTPPSRYHRPAKMRIIGISGNLALVPAIHQPPLVNTPAEKTITLR